MSAPKPYETNPTPTHSSRPPLSLQFSVRFSRLHIQEISHFICHMVSIGVADYKLHAGALLKVTYMHKLYLISNFRITTGANVFETLHLQLKYIAYTDS